MKPWIVVMAAVVLAACGMESNPAAAGTIAVGAKHACAVVDGGVQCWGDNSKGQLGNPVFGDMSKAIDVPLLRPGTNAGVTAIATGPIWARTRA